MPAGNVGVVGWDIMPDGNEILEMRVAAGGGMVPGGIDAALPGDGFSAAMLASRSELFALAHLVLGACEDRRSAAGTRRPSVCCRYTHTHTHTHTHTLREA